MGVFDWASSAVPEQELPVLSIRLGKNGEWFWFQNTFSSSTIDVELEKEFWNCAQQQFDAVFHEG